MLRAARPPLPLLLALGLLVACGGSGGEPGSGALYDARAAAWRVEPPADPHHAAIAVRPDGEVVVRKGLTDEDRAAGRAFPSSERSGWTATRVHLAAHGGQPWLTAQRAVDRVVRNGDTLVDLVVHTDGAPARRLRIPTGLRSIDPWCGRQRLRLVFVLEEGLLRLEGRFSDGPWLRQHGCGAASDSSWAWVGGRALVSVRALVLDALALCKGALDVRVEVPGLRWLSAPTPPGEPPATRPTVAEVADLLDELRQAGVAFVDLGLHSYRYPARSQGLVEEGLGWLAAHPSPEGAWDADGFLAWCHGEPMAADDLGDGRAHFDVGATGAALLAFQGAGYTDRGRHPFAKTVRGGLRSLRTRQHPDGTFDAAHGPDGALAHALATAALTHAYARTASPLWRGPATGALAALPAAWRAGGDDVSATAATLLAVEAAGLAIADAEKRRAPRPWTLDADFLADLHASCRAWASGSTHREIATGIAGCLFLGDDPRDVSWVEAVSAAAASDLRSMDPWALYLYLVAAFRMRGPTWKVWTGAWNRVLESYALPQDGGHKCCLDGSWAVPEGLTLPGGRVEATAAYLMANELYYRYDKVLR